MSLATFHRIELARFTPATREILVRPVVEIVLDVYERRGDLGAHARAWRAAADELEESGHGFAAYFLRAQADKAAAAAPPDMTRFA